MFSNELNSLIKTDALREITVGDRRCLIHRDHRWTLVLLHWAQEQGLLPRPCNLVMFDAHHDALEPACAGRLDGLRTDGLSAEVLVDVCTAARENDYLEHLNPLDDDWVQAGMRLGLIRNAVIFGVHDTGGQHFPLDFRDGVGEPHRIDVLARPNSELGYQGELGDSIRINQAAWEVLGWGRIGEQRWFLENQEPVLFDIDLDYFAIIWDDYTFPWPEEIFEREFLEPSQQYTTIGRTTQDFFVALLGRAGLVTVSTEPRHCGDGDLDGPKVTYILDRLNQFGFGGRMRP